MAEFAVFVLLTEGPLVKKLPQIKHIVCVASGKGGVGKSTTAVNLAVALRQLGCTVGLLDADIYGPSVPLMMGIAHGTRPEVREQRLLVPIEAHGVECISMGVLVDARAAMVWRAPMVISAFNQILTDTAWSELDFLIVDMPPGTGDIQLSLAQSVEVTGAVIVTTPQDVALAHARKGIEMFQKVGVPILGIVENMAMHVCSQCGHSEAIFGSEGGSRLAAEYGGEVIGRLPLDIQIREKTDSGDPVVASSTDSVVARAYTELAENVGSAAEHVAALRAEAPKITISDD